MKVIISDLKIELNEIKKALFKLKKYPGNSTYKGKFRFHKINFEKNYRTLLKIIPLDKVKTLIDKINSNFDILKEEGKYKEKIKSVNRIKDLFDNIEVELHDIQVPEVLLPSNLEKKLKEDFSDELRDLELVYGRSGNCTAFILRKILEKSIFFSFSRNGLIKKIEDPRSPNKFVNLKTMINLASKEKISGTPILNSKTADKIQGIKFLGDTAAHNFLINVNMEDITPQMPFIIAALKEITSHF